MERKHPAPAAAPGKLFDVDRILDERLPPANGYLVSYSGGKDSLATLDLTLKAGKPVVGFFMYLVPGLDYTQFLVDYAMETWGVKVLTYQHWALSHDFREGLFRARPVDVPKLTVTDVEFLAKRDTGYRWIGIGYKKNDSLERRGMITGWYNEHGKPWNPKRGCYTLIEDWSHNDVRGYLDRNGIKVPGLDRGGSNGVAIDPFTMEWLREFWPDDYKRVLKAFPYAVAQADRAPMIREWKEKRRREKIAARKEMKASAENQVPVV